MTFGNDPVTGAPTLTGTPTTTGTFTFELTADNGVGTPATLAVTVNVTAAPAIEPPSGPLGWLARFSGADPPPNGTVTSSNQALIVVDPCSETSCSCVTHEVGGISGRRRID